MLENSGQKFENRIGWEKHITCWLCVGEALTKKMVHRSGNAQAFDITEV
jgi:hypothetical protein